LRIPIKIRLPEVNFNKPFEGGLAKELLNYSFSLSELLNGGLKFTENFNCESHAVADTGAANTEFAVAHTLKRVPTGYLVIKNSTTGAVYDGATTWTTTNIYLRCSIANANITVIIL